MNLRANITRRRISLTPMIDVVFLLLVFFMLAARFSTDGAIEVSLSAGSAETYDGPPRLIDISPNSTRLNGRDAETQDMLDVLATLVATPNDAIVLRARDDANVQRIIDVMELLRAAGYTNLVLVE